ncbi:hypothetical protein [Massilia sp. H6]|uniref:hypothetical protein n=1 Tax=Massilia sp. H6 TaxID=2970464 RepID=UPI002169780B|nr:hypothetical protein [Massilia sp. H6]UVW30730.1 hypothetical protein NRS07_20045 [Massilia sp. H6]
MGKAMQSSKLKAAAPPARATGAATKGIVQTSAKGEHTRRGIRRAPAALSDAAADQLDAGTTLLARAMSHFATTARAGENNPAADEFRKAYASIVHFLPKKTRLEVLGAMRQGIDEVVRAESGKASVAEQQPERVSTADFMATLRHQEQARREREVTTGDLLTGVEMQRRLHISAQALSAAMKRKRIFALKGESGKYLYPAFFADPAYDRTTLERVCQALGDLPGSSKLHFFTSPRYSLRGLSPLEALAKGRVDAVIDQANAFCEG